jgi:hypothetical protein
LCGKKQDPVAEAEKVLPFFSDKILIILLSARRALAIRRKLETREYCRKSGLEEPKENSFGHPKAAPLVPCYAVFGCR